MKCPIIFHIDADAFFASIEQSYHPALQGKPVVVGGLANQRGVVHTASYEARQRGIRTAMSLMRAKEICPEAIFLKGNFQHYQAVSRHLQDIYLRFTPMVEFTSQDDAYLDFSGTERLYSTPLHIARKLWSTVWHEVGISMSIGIGRNKLIARLASEILKPGGIYDVPPGTELAFLAPLPVEALPGIGHKSRDKLRDLGIYTIAQLREIPRIALEDLFGLNGRKFYDMTRAIDKRRVEKRIRPKSISRETTFEEDVTDIHVIKATLQYLTERIAAKLRDQRLVARQLSVKLRYSDFKQYELHQTLTESTDDSLHLFATVQELLERFPERRIRIRLVGVRTTQIDWKDWQMGLFATPTLSVNINKAIDDIRAKFGFMSILPADTLRLHGRYRMERNGFVLHSPALTE